MKRAYYLFNPGRLSRKDQTLCFVATDEHGNTSPAKYLPVESVESLYCFGSLDANSALYNFLGKAGIAVHFFDYYEHYTGSFMPKDYLLAGKMQIEQTRFYLNKKKRIVLAQAFIEGGTANMLRNLKYYQNRGRDLEPYIEKISGFISLLKNVEDIPTLMGIEGNIRKVYYEAFNSIIHDFEIQQRVKRPPDNEINALISFGNSLCYAMCLGQIYHTQLNPTISFLHEPGYRRYALALDITEVFKPILVDRLIFKVLNTKALQEKHFDKSMNGCVLNKTGKEVFVRNWEEKLSETIKHRTLDKQVSYKYLVKLECYKIQKFILGLEPLYKPFKIWW